MANTKTADRAIMSNPHANRVHPLRWNMAVSRKDEGDAAKTAAWNLKTGIALSASISLQSPV
jgi:hypothetical protein